jgi:Protein of unknown function (DUF4232)
MFISLRPAATLIAVVAAAAWLVTACGSAAPGQPGSAPTVSPAGPATGTPPPGTDPPGSAPSATAPPVTAPSVTAPSATAPSASPSPVKPGGQLVAACRAASLLITMDDSQAGGAAGSRFYPLNFTNTSATACQMYGYPGVSFTAAPTASGKQIGAAAERNRAFPKLTVRLAPGGTAHAWLEVTVAANYPASACQPVTAHWLRVYPPGGAVAGYVSHAFGACSSPGTSLLTVLPVRAGQAQAAITP